MFKQGKKPALVVPDARLGALRSALRRAGYAPHTSSRWVREGEIEAWTLPLADARQVHVQLVARRGGRVAVFAHTEPASGPAHWISAVMDRADFASGAKRVRADLRAARF